MSKQLLERTVQDEALKYMVDYYKWRAKKNKVWNKIEVRTKKGKRADGLIAYRKRVTGGVFVASMEAKSYKTLHNIRPKLDTNLWVKNSLYYGTWLAFGVAIFLLYWRLETFIETPRQGLMMVINSYVIVLVLVAIATRGLNMNQTMDVFKQVLQYKANEQWVAISKDSYEQIDKRLQKPFERVLKARGVGLLIVSGRKKVRRVHKPKRSRKFFGDYLKYYAIGEEIHKALKA